MPARPTPLNRKPWPMKWVVLAIVACLIPYTWLTLAYRKEGRAYEPYQDNKDRAQVLRLLDAGFRRVDLPIERLVEPGVPGRDPATAEPVAGGVPALLSELLIDSPALPDSFSMTSAPATALADAPYAILLTADRPTPDQQPVHSILYLRGAEAVFVIGYDDLPGTLQARGRPAPLRLSVPAHTFAPGTYHGTLVGAQESRRWTFEIH